MVTSRTPWLPLLALWCVSVASALGAERGDTPVESPPTIDIPSIGAAPKRDVTLDDMVSLREVHEPRQSPDGRWVAFLVKQAFRTCDCYRYAVYLASTEKRVPPRKLVEAEYIANLQWSPDGKYLTYLSPTDGTVQLSRVDPVTSKTETMFVHVANRDQSAEHAAYQSLYLPPSGVLSYQWAPDGKSIAFISEPPVDPTLGQEAAKHGFRYDDSTMSSLGLTVGDWVPSHRTKQLWIYDVVGKREHLVWATAASWYAHITALSWALDSQTLAFAYSNPLNADSDSLAVLDVRTSAVSLLGDVGGTDMSSASVAWAADGSSIAYLARAGQLGAYKLQTLSMVDHRRSERRWKIAPSLHPWLAWDSGRKSLRFLSGGIGLERASLGLYSLSDDGEPPARVTAMSDKIDECDVILRGKVACVMQSPSVPAQPALVTVTSGHGRGLAEVNPEVASLDLAPIRELRWANRFGEETNGYLVLPTHRTPGVRLPLVVVGYHFDGEFVLQASSTLTTYPAQALARDGIAVLLFNYPRFEGWSGPDFARGSHAIGYGPLASIQAAIEQLDAEGLVDPERVGMMGHSLAGFWVELGITQTRLFRAVEIHNGGTSSEPGMYWESGTKHLRELQERVMGGPPYGDTLKNYLGFSFTLNASRVRAPVLMEFDAVEAQLAMEYYEAMQHYELPVDFFVYPNDTHVTEKPEHRFASLRRNLDWFEFWLLDKENDPQANSEQYARWRQFRAAAARVDGEGRLN